MLAEKEDHPEDDESLYSSSLGSSGSESFSDLEEWETSSNTHLPDDVRDTTDLPDKTDEVSDPAVDVEKDEGMERNISKKPQMNSYSSRIEGAVVADGRGSVSIALEEAQADDKLFNAGMFSPFPFSDGGLLKRKTLTLDKKAFVTDRYPTSFPSYPSDRRSLIALEIYTTERSFVRGLEVIVHIFKLKIESTNSLDAKESYSVFANVDKILEFNINIMREIFVRISDWSDEKCIADVFLENKDGFNLYAEYCKNYDTGEELIRQKRKKKDFDQLLQNCSRSNKVMAGQSLSSYLITVVQRIPRYILLLKDLAKRTPDSHPDGHNLQEAVSVMQNKANYINEQLKLSQCQRALEALQTQITGLKEYYIPSRTLVYEGPVCLLTGKKTYQGVLFNDLMVFAFKGDNKQSVVQLVLQLNTVWIEDLESLDPQTTRGDSIGIYTPDRPYRMYVGTSGEKKIWLQNLRAALASFIIEKDHGLSMRMSCYTYKDGSMYEGSFINSKRHGKGKMTCPNLSKYEGEWEDDERNGLGVAKYCTGEVYDGYWKDDKKDGLGTFTYISGDEISGEWKNGMKHGTAVINYKNGDRFSGKCVNDNIEGHGELTCKNGFYYCGDWSKNLKHGKGKLKDIDGTTYIGEFSQGRFDGDGEITYPDGSSYKGRFERGLKCGYGIFTDMSGCIYDGEWKNDIKHGNGVITYENGDKYTGSWQFDMKYGQGHMIYSLGGSYQGTWEVDLKHGKGVIEFKNGAEYEGEFFNDMICGEGKMVYQDGSEYQGIWRNNHPNGNGTLRKNGEWVCIGKWLNGKQHGVCKLEDPANSHNYEGDWINGLKQGRGIERIDGFVYEGLFLQGLRHGNGVESIPGGGTYSGTWYRGHKHGKGDLKHPNGLIEHQIWKHGCLTESPLAFVPRERTPVQKWL